MKKSKFRDSTKSLCQKNSSNNIQDRMNMVKEKNNEEHQTRVQKQN